MPRKTIKAGDHRQALLLNAKRSVINQWLLLQGLMNLKMQERSPEQEKIEKRRLVCYSVSFDEGLLSDDTAPQNLRLQLY